MREFRDLCVSEDRYGHFEVNMSFCDRLCVSGRVYAFCGLIEREKTLLGGSVPSVLRIFLSLRT